MNISDTPLHQWPASHWNTFTRRMTGPEQQIVMDAMGVTEETMRSFFIEWRRVSPLEDHFDNSIPGETGVKLYKV